MSLDTIIGVLTGSAVTILVTYLTHRLTENREIRKIEIEREGEAISQVFSPLVFILDKTRDLFARIGALHDTLRELSEKEDTEKKEVLVLHYFALKGVESYPQALEDLLMHKAGLIKSRSFYIDLVILQSYLSTIVTFLIRLISKSGESPLETKRCISALGPIIAELDKAISDMRKYSMAQTSRWSEYEYKQFFTERKYSEIEDYINRANKAITGEGVIDWSFLLKRLSEEGKSI